MYSSSGRGDLELPRGAIIGRDVLCENGLVVAKVLDTVGPRSGICGDVPRDGGMALTQELLYDVHMLPVEPSRREQGPLV